GPGDLRAASAAVDLAAALVASHRRGRDRGDRRCHQRAPSPAAKPATLSHQRLPERGDESVRSYVSVRGARRCGRGVEAAENVGCRAGFRAHVVTCAAPRRSLEERLTPHTQWPAPCWRWTLIVIRGEDATGFRDVGYRHIGC